VTPAAQGTPSSRLTIIAWLPIAPTSTTTADDTMNSGVQGGIGLRGDEHLARLEVGDCGWVAHHPGPPARYPGRRRSTLQNVTGPGRLRRSDPRLAPHRRPGPHLQRGPAGAEQQPVPADPVVYEGHVGQAPLDADGYYVGVKDYENQYQQLWQVAG
jgi:hypothetical protein